MPEHPHGKSGHDSLSSQVSDPAESSGDARAFAPRSMHKIDLNLLVPLQALLVEANVTRAAERTNVGQPAMSASLARLRRHFNDPLLVRDGRDMKLTSFAASLMEPLNQVLGSMHALMETHATFDACALRRTFTIVTSDYVTIVLIKPLLQDIAEVAPGVAFNILPPSMSMPSLLRRVECDMVIAPRSLLPQDMLSYQNRDLFTDRFVVVADKDNATIGDSLSRDELTRLSYIDSLQDLELPDRRMPITMSMSAGNFTAPMYLVAGTRMVTLVQARLFELFGPRCGLRAVPLEEELPLTEAMYWHPKYTADPAHIWLRARLHDIAVSL